MIGLHDLLTVLEVGLVLELRVRRGVVPDRVALADHPLEHVRVHDYPRPHHEERGGHALTGQDVEDLAGVGGAGSVIEGQYQRAIRHHSEVVEREPVLADLLALPVLGIADELARDRVDQPHRRRGWRVGDGRFIGNAVAVQVVRDAVAVVVGHRDRHGAGEPGTGVGVLVWTSRVNGPSPMTGSGPVVLPSTRRAQPSSDSTERVGDSMVGATHAASVPTASRTAQVMSTRRRSRLPLLS